MQVFPMVVPLLMLQPCFRHLFDAVRLEAQYQRSTAGLVPRVGYGKEVPQPMARISTNALEYLEYVKPRYNAVRLDNLSVQRGAPEEPKEHVVMMESRKCPESANPPCQFRGGHWMRCKLHAWLAM